MIKRIVGWVVLVPFCAVLVVFALANRQIVDLSFDPLPGTGGILPVIPMPLFLIIYIMLVLGVVLGGFATWITQGANRREKRRLKRENDQLHKEVEQLRRGPRPSGSGQRLLTPQDMLEDDLLEND